VRDAFFDAIYPFFQWMQESALTTAMQASWWAGAAANIGHLLSLVMFMGGVMIVNLRLIGAGITDQPLSQVSREARPWMLAGFTGLALTGVIQLASLAERNFYNWNFWFKMTMLLFTVIYTLVIWRPAIRSDAIMAQPMKARLVGLISFLMWMGVVIPGRLIGLT
jgi:hypothetical protein